MLPFQAVDLGHVAQTQLYADFSCLCLPCCWPHKLCQYVFVPLSQHPSASRTCPHHFSSLRLSNDLASRIKHQTYSSLLIKYFQLRLLTLSNHILMRIMFYIYDLLLWAGRRTLYGLEQLPTAGSTEEWLQKVSDCPLEITTTKPGLQVVPANLFQVSCPPPVSQLPVRQMCQAAGGFTGRSKEGQEGKRRFASCLLFIPRLHSLQPHISQSCPDQSCSPFSPHIREGEIQGQQLCTSLNKGQASATVIETSLRQ